MTQGLAPPSTPRTPERSTSTASTVREPWTRQRVVLRVVLTAAVPLVVVSGWLIEFNLASLADGADDVVRLLERMLPPRMEDTGRIVDLAIQTFLIAFLGTVLATVLSVPLAFLAARNTTPHRVVHAVARGVITFCRAVPDLVFAVLFVRALGIGVLPGVLALALHSVGMVAKLYADAIERADHGPREAIRATGVGRVRELVTGVVSQVVPAWIAAFLYRIDINLRMSVVLGFVGAGGIGFALQDSLRGLVYDKALGIVAVILVIIAVVELLSIGVRRLLLGTSVVPTVAAGRLTPPWTRDRIAIYAGGLAIVGLTVGSFAVLRIDPVRMIGSVGQLVAVFGRLLPPDFSTLGGQLGEAVVETLAIAVVATTVGAALSLPLGVLAARNVTPHPSAYWAARAIILAVRAVPELVLAVIFVAAIGLGPIAGACALGIGSIGFLGKLVADAVEEVPPGPREAVRAVGGGWWKQLFSAVLPQALPAMIGSGLYLLDVNIRTSTVLGVVGAGGVGFLLFEAIRTLQFELAGAIIGVVFVVVYVIERLSGWIRSQLT